MGDVVEEDPKKLDMLDGCEVDSDLFELQVEQLSGEIGGGRKDATGT